MAGSGADSTRVVITALFANFIIAISKLVAWSFTRSSAMLAEAAHSLADTGNQVLMLIGLKRAARPPDRDHPYGYGKETYFWSFVVAISIFTLGAAFAFYEGTHKLVAIFGPGESHVSDQTVGIVVLAVSIVVEGYAFLVALKAFRRDIGDVPIKQALLESRAAAVITVLFEDTAAVAGLFIALVGILLSAATGNPIFDAIATICIGIILTVVAFFLGWMTKRLLIGHSASSGVEDRIADAITQVDHVLDIIELKTLHMGRDFILLNVGVKFSPNLKTIQLEATIDEIERRVTKAVPQVKRIFIEVDSFRQHPRDPDAGSAPEPA